jgi:hypothetical protein
LFVVVDRLTNQIVRYDGSACNACPGLRAI